MPAYPLTFPSTIIPRSIDFTTRVQSSKFQSPFNGQTQIHKYQGSWWELNLTFPPLFQEQAEELTGFLTGLYGQVGSFYYTIPSKFQASGSISLTMGANGSDFTLSSGSAQIGKFGADEDFRLAQFTSTSSLFPNLKSGATTIEGNRGALFRLAGDLNWSVDHMVNSSVTIPIVETMGQQST